MKRILVVNVNWLGDVVFSSPVFYALKEVYPDSFIVCMADPRVRSVLECIDAIDKIVEYDEKGKHKWWWSKLSVIEELYKEQCDIAFMLHGSTTKALMAKIAGIKVRVGSPIKKKQQFLTDVITPLAQISHRSDDYLNIIEGYGINVSQRNTRLSIHESDLTEMDMFLSKYRVSTTDKLVGINIGANWELKRWANENFRQLIRVLLDSQKKVVVTGAAQDKTEVDELLKSIDHDNCINLTGKTSLSQLIALLKRLDVFVCADSGPLHIANSLGTSVIGLFGPTRSEVTGPRGIGQVTVLHCDVGCNQEPCYFLDCPDNICMQAISVDMVLEKIKELIV